MKIILISIFAFHFQAIASTSFSSFHLRAFNAQIKNGVMLTPHKTKKNHQIQIKNQLKFLIGAINEDRGGMDFTKLNFSIKKVEKLGEFNKVFYKANFLVFINSSKDEVVKKYIIPKRGDLKGRKEFLIKYSEKCRKNIIPTPMGTNNFWYRFRPQKKGCPLNLAKNDDVFDVNLKLTKADNEKLELRPLYKKLWINNELHMTLVFSKSKESNPFEKDNGVKAFKEFKKILLENFGRPFSYNRDPMKKIEINDRYFNFKYNYLDRVLNIHFFLVDDMKNPPPLFISQFQEVSRKSTYISYSGHAGLGGSIEKFVKLIPDTKLNYQVVFVNGCTTFSYVYDGILLERQHGNNYRLDIITNATPSFFSMNAESNLVVIDSLLNGFQNYTQILEYIDKRQLPVVKSYQLPTVIE